MERDFWLERWENNQIGFHQAEFSPYLKEHWPQIAESQDCQVFVPMAGKTLDMIWLANFGHKVTGVELSELAVDAFFDENNLPVEKSQVGEHIRHSAGNIELLCGDYFKISAEDTANVKAVYDRASMIAMPPALRTQYAAHMAQLLKPGTKVLLISMEYAGGDMQGPPFSVTEKEVHELFDDNFEVTLLQTVDVLEKNQRFKERGLETMLEKVYRMVRKRKLD